MHVDEEIWKDIEGFEGLYQISDKGRVKSLEKTYTDRNGATRHKDEKILNPYPNKRGYMRLQLFGEKRVEWKLVHRLVAEAFLPNPDNLPIINHKDETPFHNNVENLEYCTQKYNVNYGTGIQPPWNGAVSVSEEVPGRRWKSFLARIVLIQYNFVLNSL